MIDPKDVKKGGLIRWKPMRDFQDLLKSLRIMTDPGSGISHEETSSGTRLWLTESPEIPIRITARDGVNYAWNAVQAIAGGGWDDLVAPAGTLSPLKDPATEVNGVVASTPQIVLGRREEWTHRMTFSRELC